MPELKFYENNDSYVFFVISQFSDSLFDYCFSGFRWLIGFLLAGNFVNTSALVSWFVEIALIDFLLNRVILLLLECFLSQDMHLELFKTISSQMLSAWFLSLLLNQSLIILLFSQALYWLFATYSQFFSRRILESISVFYYFSNFWFLFPVIVNLCLSLVYILDTMFSTQFLFKLFEFKFVKKVLEEWGINTLINHHPLPENGIELHHFPDMTAYSGLSEEERLNFHILKQRYLHNHSEEFIETQLEEIKSYLATQYYANQPQLLIHHITYQLPLEWHDFLKYRMRVAPVDQIHMYSTYLHNEYHTAWRFLSKEHYWMQTDLKNKESKQAIFEAKNLEFIITIWTVLKKQNQGLGQAGLFETKADMFIKILARINRLGNHQNQFYMNLSIRDYEADKIGSLSLLYPNLMALVSEKHPQAYISLNVVQHLLDSFAKSAWVTHMLKLDRGDILYLYHIWNEIQESKHLYPEFHHLFYPLNFSSSHKDDFILKMNILFGKSWLETNDYLRFIQEYFDINKNQNESHVSLNPKVFSDALQTLAQHYHFNLSLESHPLMTV